MQTLPEPGSIIGQKYRVVRRLGEGGMGVVFEAVHQLTEKRVALKLLKPAFAERPELVQRLLREAQASARVRHPNVVDVFDVGTHDDTFFLVMEYLEGEPLSQALRRGPMPLSQVLSLLIPAMRGVAAGHACGIIHRDIKPDNIFLARVADMPEPLVKVLDFGISKVPQSSGEDLSLTETGVTLGTPLYMSYEQLSGLRDVDARTDVYAFGVILYEALTGRTPFRADSLAALAVQIATTMPSRPSELQPTLHPALDDVLMRAIARDRDRRFASIEALLAALALFSAEGNLNVGLETQDFAPPLPVANPPASATPPAPHTRPRRLWLALSATLVLALAYAWLRVGAAEEAQASEEARSLEHGPSEFNAARTPQEPSAPAAALEPAAVGETRPREADAPEEPETAAAPERATAAAPRRKTSVSKSEPFTPAGSTPTPQVAEPAAVAPANLPAAQPAAPSAPSASPTTQAVHRAGKPTLDEF